MPRVDRIGIVHIALGLFAVALVGRAAQVQILQRDRWNERALKQQYTASELPAPRGRITDATGLTLAESRELVRIAVAPHQVRDRKALARALQRVEVPASWIARATDTRRKWVELPGRFLPTDVAPVVAMRGVHATPVAERVYIPSEGVRRIVGRATPAGGAVDGIELALDSLLAGVRGTATTLRDARGRTFESPTARGTRARPGHTVVLTLNHALQDLAERTLADAVAQQGAIGGDIVVLEPRTGELLALASRRTDPRSTASTALTEPYEPGSTLKPFVAAALLDSRLARTDEVIETFDGRYTIHGRTVNDIKKAPRLTLREVIQHSSNVGIVRFAERLPARAQYEMLRDLGFGTPTGLPYPSESPGRVTEPARWSRQSPASLAMGYELAVTPVQLATAYAAIANGGLLMQPSLVKEIRSPDGEVRFRHRPRVVRRVMSDGTSRALRGILRVVVDSGTSVGADLATFDVGGKSGTARRTTSGRYVQGEYTASFVGLFPADAPQYVILVKLDAPSAGAYYGGRIASPVFRTFLQGALASRDASLDRGSLAERARPVAPRPVADSADTTYAVVARREAERLARGDTGEVPYVYNLAAPPVRRAVVPAARPVPDVRGLTVRGAVHALHAAGFQVRLDDGALVSELSTTPAAGAVARPGSLVRLIAPR